MQSHARVVVVGGGIFGASVLYHLAHEGWTDIVLIEKGELTSGTTWHAAGQCPHFTGSMTLALLHDYGIKLYQKLEAETGQSTGWHGPGGIRLARNKEELSWHRHVSGIAKQVGYRAEVVDLSEIRKIHPYIELHDVVGGTYTPEDGHVDPTGATNAMALGARKLGATIYRHTLATDIKRDGDNWRIITDKGEIRCEHLVLATGFFSNQVGEWIDLELPLVNVVHQYLVTEPVPDLANKPGELPVLRDPGSSSYIRQEQRGLLGGPYENAGIHTVHEEGVPWSFNMDLLDPDLDRISPWLDQMIARMPLFGTVGIRRVISGFIAHTPDLNPLIGPVAGHTNLWTACGSAIGIAQGPGLGKCLAQWMVHGAADISMVAFDPRRFSRLHKRDWVKARTVEASEGMYDLHPPGYYFKSGRPLRMSPLQSRLESKGAIFGEAMGWERPKWFDTKRLGETYSYIRNNSFEAVGAECAAVRERVGVLDLTSFSKFEVAGSDASAFLNHAVANRLPARDGGISLCHLLTDNGKIDAEMTITRLKPDHYYVLSASSSQSRDFDLLSRARRGSYDVTIHDVTKDFGCLVVSGPRSRALLQRVTDTDLSNGSFKWMSAKQVKIAGNLVRALRVSYAGELGWELHVPIDSLIAVYDALFAAGSDLGISDFGLYALNSLRIEKAYRGFGAELMNEISLLEAGMERFVAFEKGDFIGKAALLNQKQQGIKWQLSYLDVSAHHLDILGSEPVMSGEDVIGTTTSGGYGHTAKKNLAFAFLRPDAAKPGRTVEVQMLGKRYPATILSEPVYDPTNEKMRS
ncbi:MAG: FAD-dependent oxidoreductase [Alphaproteobacteria bacterium]